MEKLWSNDGFEVGQRDGFGVGDGVGSDVGSSVGDDVGDGVGSGVSAGVGCAAGAMKGDMFSGQPTPEHSKLAAAEVSTVGESQFIFEHHSSTTLIIFAPLVNH